MEIRPIAHIRTDFPTKFGLPRQSGLVEQLEGVIAFEPEYRQAEALRGLEGFSHIWLIWDFSQAHTGRWSATVRSPKLGGNTRMGVFATRSPFRPNSLGLSCVRLRGIEQDGKLGAVLRVGGIDMMDGTPIYDIKPYVPVADCHPEASEGFTARTGKRALRVEFPPEMLALVPPEKREALIGALEQDPRPGYEDDPERRYGVEFAGLDVRFFVAEGVLRVCEVAPGGADAGPGRG